ncbi:hypothetical protein CFOL_v3_08556 [Cephalotus follicularis]|uniref:Uncharacterized protein n=1 Tax=Cephalotus follicularis TaxID=3775 RepID=A0A1Q3BAJ2_CEPFO|nr:hypothetical protein CFOL_v3_08556 [Cephalotus follicularis]
MPNEPHRITSTSMGDGCKWRMHSSVLSDEKTFMVETMNPLHTCSRLLNIRVANSTWIANQLDDLLKAYPNMSYEIMQETLAKLYNVNTHPKQLYRARKKALEKNEEKHSKAYSYLYNYANLIKETNPGSIIKFGFETMQEDYVGPPKF